MKLHQVALRALGRGKPESEGGVPPGAVGLSAEQQQRWAQRIARHLVAATRTLTRLFLVHSLPESLKLAFVFYLLTYVGAVFNGVTLLGVGVISAFTFPVLYRHRQAQIDHYLSVGRKHLRQLRARLRATLPSAKAKPQ
ncbi:reticulon-2-like [Numida meleagris]|uniref:reticulon-2-like n=1 Tax=Numida meleagris TaxID=8996 RepID=UPI000B3DA369|nr:reticulon-2-like [Numida meleagris]